MTKAKQTTWKNRIVGHGEEPLDQILFNPANWRIHPKAQQDALEGVLSSVGWVQDVIVNKTTGRLVDGHLRCQVAARNGEKSIPVVYVELDEAEEALILASIDPISAMAATDKAKLDELMRQVQSDDARVQQMMAEIAEKEGLEYGKKEPPQDPGAQVDKAEELREKWQTASGQLWQLGDHRLICGDCTDKATVERLMQGEKAQLCFTDPPYGANIQYATHDDTQDALAELIAGFFPIAEEYCEVIALTPGIANIWKYKKPDWIICWFYGVGTGSTPFGFSAWQPLMVFGADPKLAAGEGRHPDGFQLLLSKEDHAEMEKLGHVVPKPLSVWERLLERMTNKKTKIVYEPFNGSGTTIIACEKVGLSARAVEISPAYVAVALERWSTMTGKTPQLLE